MSTIEALRQRERIGHDLTGVTSAEEALSKAGLDWGLQIVPAENMTVITDDGVVNTSSPGRRLVLRDDNAVCLGMVGGRYETVDNRSVFSLTQHVLDAGGVYLEGGELDLGRRAYMRMGLPGTEVSLLNGKDLLNFGVVFRASHDGTGNVTANIECTRLVCANGMTAKMRIPHQFNVRHTANVSTRMEEAQEILRGAVRYAKGFAAAAAHMLDTNMSKAEFTEFIDGLFPKPENEGRAVTIWETRRSALLSLFSVAPTNEAGRGTAWAGYNAVTEYLDWEAPIRSTDGTPLTRVRAVRQFEETRQDVKDLAFAALT